jgi:DNA-binding transcriptional LysR family regulator
VLEAACNGFGLALLPLYVVRKELADGLLERVLVNHEVPAHDIHAVYTSPKLVSKKVSHFVDFLQRSLKGEWWEG